jgi:hypothetical protein
MYMFKCDENVEENFLFFNFTPQKPASVLELYSNLFYTVGFLWLVLQKKGKNNEKPQETLYIGSG